MKEGFWVDYLGPMKLRAADDDMSLVYHEGERWQFFYGKICSEPCSEELFVPDEAQWQERMPDWLQGRRDLVVQRIQQKFKHVHLHNRAPVETPSPTREEMMAEYQEKGYYVLPLPDGTFAATPSNGTSPVLIRREEAAQYAAQGWRVQTFPDTDICMAYPR